MRSKKDESAQKIKDFEIKLNSYQSEYRIKESRYKFLVETEKEKENIKLNVSEIISAVDKLTPTKKGGK